MKIAVIDVGYNSMKMVKYRAEPDASARSYGQLGFMAMLGEGLEHTGRLGVEPMSRTTDAIGICKETASLEAIDHLLLIGTSPVREASNREEFLQRVKEETGLRMRVLTGNEEALYGFLGAARSVGAPTALFFDLGGGSLEITYAERSKIRRILSLPLGALKLTALYAGSDGRISRKGRAKMSKKIQQLLPTRRELGLDKETVLVGTGGTVRAMARYEQYLVEYPFNKIHNYSIEYDSVQKMSRDFLGMKPEELDGIEAIGEDRSRTIAAGALVVKLLMDQLGFERITVSTHGVRDGILTEFLARGEPAQDKMAQKEEIEKLLAPAPLAARLAGSAELVEQLVSKGVFDDREGSILMTAAGKGRGQDYAEADADALFWMLMSEDLPLSHEDQLFMAMSLVRARRPRTANWLMDRYGRLLSRGDSKMVRKMGTCLRLVEIMNLAPVQVRVTYSNGFRISVLENGDRFPFGVARAAADALSASIKRPITIMAGSQRERRTEPVRARS